ncbi:ABC transporter permease [Fusobacterium ulcerans]|uniref:ABC transporter permease n=1 Tax=Fusobacterium ulcerans TaxID=861 RepID=UPI002673D662|nr:ABC transporter permease subunit [Fusobacterium ulcerans]
MRKYLCQSRWLLLSPLLFIIVWEIISRIVGNDLIFPGIPSIFKALIDIIKGKDFLSIVFHTLKRTGISIGISLVIGILCGILSYRYKFFYILFFPFFSFLKSIPTIAVIILVLIWSNVEAVPIITGIMILLPLIYENILGGIDSIDRDLLKMADIYKVSKIDILKGIYIPGVYYFSSSGIPTLIALTLKVVIAGEVLSQGSLSIGGEIFMGKIYLESSSIFAWIIIIILINFLLDISLKKLNKELTKWRKL